MTQELWKLDARNLKICTLWFEFYINLTFRYLKLLGNIYIGDYKYNKSSFCQLWFLIWIINKELEEFLWFKNR